MNVTSIAIPYKVFKDVEGYPLESGYVYIGTKGLDPETNPINVFFDTGLTIPAPQPIRTLNGYISRSGSPSNIYISEVEYSITVKNKNMSLVHTDLNANSELGAYKSVADIADLATVNPIESPMVIVSDTVRGGIFEYDVTLIATNNGGTIFDGWVRQYTTRADARWFGVKTDSSDSSSAFELAIQSGLPIDLPTGTIKANISISSLDDIDIKGAGIDKTVVKMFSELSPIMVFSTCDKLSISDLTIDGDGQDLGNSTDSIGLNLVRVSNGTFKDIKAVNTGYYGINPFECNNNIFKNLRLEGNWRHGIHPGSDTLDFNINNIYDSIISSGNGFGSGVSGASGINDRGNSIDRGGSYGNMYSNVISMTDRDGVFITNQKRVNISNISSSNSFTGISVTSCSDVNGTNINIFECAQALSINSSADSSLSSINITSSNAGDGIVVDNCERLNIDCYSIEKASTGEPIIITQSNNTIAITSKISLSNGYVETSGSNAITLVGDGTTFYGQVSITNCFSSIDALKFFSGAGRLDVNLYSNSGFLQNSFKGREAGTTDANGTLSITYRASSGSLLFADSLADDLISASAIHRGFNKFYSCSLAGITDQLLQVQVIDVETGLPIATAAVDLLWSVDF